MEFGHKPTCNEIAVLCLLWIRGSATTALLRVIHVADRSTESTFVNQRRFGMPCRQIGFFERCARYNGTR